MHRFIQPCQLALQEAVSAASYACSEATAAPAEACLASTEALATLEQLLQHLLPLGYMLLTDSFTFHILQTQQAYTAAVEPLKTAMTQCLKYIELLADHLLAATKDADGNAKMDLDANQVPGASIQPEAHLQPLLPCLAAACTSLLDLAIASAHFVAAGSPIASASTGSSSSSMTSGQTWVLADPLAGSFTKYPVPELKAAATTAAIEPAVAAAVQAAAANQVPKELASFFVLNLSWSWLNKLLRKVQPCVHLMTLLHASEIFPPASNIWCKAKRGTSTSPGDYKHVQWLVFAAVVLTCAAVGRTSTCLVTQAACSKILCTKVSQSS
jgi:hypothetical protein